MWTKQFLGLCSLLMGLLASVQAVPLVDPQHIVAGNSINTLVWTGAWKVTGDAPTSNELFSLAGMALNDAYNNWLAIYKTIPGADSAEPTTMTAVYTPDSYIYFSSSMKSLNRKLPAVVALSQSTKSAQKTVTSLLEQCAKKIPEGSSVTRLHEHSAACGEIAILYMYSVHHPDPRTIRTATDVTVGYRSNTGQNYIKEPCRKTSEGRAYGCRDVSDAARWNDIGRASAIPDKDIRSGILKRMTKMSNPSLASILPSHFCRRGVMLLESRANMNGNSSACYPLHQPEQMARAALA